MKIAILHNFLNNIGGAERVTLTLARELDADVITTVADQGMIKKMGFKQPVKEIGWIPTNPPFRQQLASVRFRFLNLSKKYDAFLIAGDWALSGAVNNKPCIWYCHTPSRELWDLYRYTREHIVPPHKRQIFDHWVRYNRHLNRRFIKETSRVIASSHQAAARLKKYLKTEAAIMHPPVDTQEYYYKENGPFWLSVNRLIRYKRIEVQLAAFKKMPDQQLVIVGSYEQSRHFREYVEHIKKIKPPNVTILHWVDRDKLRELYATCRGFVTTSHDEDFGLTAVEAMAAGKPVIAPALGGYLETVIHGVTGVLLPKVDPDLLAAAIQSVTKVASSYKEECQARARLFDTSVKAPLIHQALKEL